MLAFFPAIVAGDASEAYGAEVPATGAKGCGDTVEAALRDPAPILQGVIDDAARDGEPLPQPGPIAAEAPARGLPAVLQARMPAEAA
jgi:predicted RNase H-like HicB family nuclease